MKNDKLVSFESFRKAAKRKEIIDGIKNKFKAVGEWASKNKEIVITLTPVFIGAGFKIVKMIATNKSTKEQKELQDLYCYDRSLGHYWRLRRELSNSEWLEIDKRKKNGERLSDILDELKVLK